MKNDFKFGILSSILTIFLFSTLVFSALTINCGNGVCEREEVSSTVGEEVLVNVFGNDYTFVVDRDMDREDLKSVSSSGNADNRVRLYFVKVVYGCVNAC